MEDKLSVTFTKSTVEIALNPLQINTSQSDITRMSSDYADNELELFRKTVSYLEEHQTEPEFLPCHVLFFAKDGGSQLISAILIQIELVVGSESGKISSTDVLNSADSLTTKKMKKSETEQLLNRLVHDKWLNEVETDGLLLIIYVLIS